MWKPESAGQRLGLRWRIARCWVASFFKANWHFEDFPLHVREQDLSTYAGPERMRPCGWQAQFPRWVGLQGHGNTREEAAANLHSNFDAYVASGKKPPRPGTYKELEFEIGSRERISRFPELEDEFIRDILELPWAFLSDQSTLWEIHSQEDNEPLYAKITAKYGVDASDVADANIAAILAKIDAETKRP